MHAITFSRAALKRAAASMCLLAALVSAGCGGGGGDSAPATPTPTTYTLGGTVSGLTASGLVLANAGTPLTVASGATTFTFGSVLAAGTSYAVTVQTQPTGLTCTVASGTGSAVAANVGNVAVTCVTTTVATFTLGGTITGLTTSGLVLANAGTTVTVASGAATFTLGSILTAGSSYAVVVQTQPTGLTCTVANGTGTAVAANVGNVAVTCVPKTFTIGGSITGLSSAGLVLHNGADSLTVASGATTFTMGTSVAFGASYAVTVFTQPTGLTCTATSGSGTVPAANVTSVVITCTVNSYTLGGTISGLTTTGLVLANAGGSVTVAANATSFTFPASVVFGTAYAVTITTQPQALTCTLSGATGTMPGANVSSVQVTCAPPVSAGWTWIGGATVSTNAGGQYGTQGTASAGNTPGSRYQASSVKDSSGTLWLFGGSGWDAQPANDRLNDLWKFDVTSRQWTWISGSVVIDQLGNYTVQGTPAPSSVPGARNGAFTWADASGNIWVFGGEGYGNTTTVGYLDDLWKFTVSTGLWTYVGGYPAVNLHGIYGTQGTPSTSNIPGGRRSGASWVDSAGNFWLFGGTGVDAATPGNQGPLNDLWKYNPTTGEWTWVSGSTAIAALGVYGTQGTPSSTTVPGARQGSQGFTDLSGNMWLFGGFGPSASVQGFYNDLWKYSPSTGQWTWVKGSTGINASGVYGTKGTGAAGNTPGGRNATGLWTDAAGNFWVFGGFGYDSLGTGNVLNDLWKYQPSTNQWTWIHGSNQVNAAGVYGTQSVASQTNDPGARTAGATWIDNAGAMWLFGGNGLDGSGASGLLIDMWKY